MCHLLLFLLQTKKDWRMTFSGLYIKTVMGWYCQKKWGEYFYTWKLDQWHVFRIESKWKSCSMKKDKKSHSQVLCLFVWNLTSMKNYVMGTCTKVLYSHEKKRRHYAFMKNITLTSLWTVSDVLLKNWCGLLVLLYLAIVFNPHIINGHRVLWK